MTSTDDQVQYAWCPLAREAELRQFINDHWRRDHILARDAALLRWQFPHPDDHERLSVMIADCGGRLVGMLGIIPTKFNLRGRTDTAAVFANWFVVQDERHRNVGLELLRAVMAGGYGFLGTLGVNATAQRLFRGLRFAVATSVPRWLKSFSTDGLRDLLSRGGEQYTPEAREHILASLDASLPALPTSDCLVEDFGTANSELWQIAWRERFAPPTIGLTRDAAYLQWRYVDHPGFRYYTRVALNRDRSAALGLLVYRLAEIQDTNLRVLRIVDLLADEQAAPALAAEIARVGREAQVAFADFYCTGETFAEPLVRLGFAREDRLPAHLPSLFQPLDFRRSSLTGAFYVRPDLADDSVQLFQSPNVYFTRSDADQDRPN